MNRRDHPIQRWFESLNGDAFDSLQIIQRWFESLNGDAFDSLQIIHRWFESMNGGSFQITRVCGQNNSKVVGQNFVTSF